MVSRQDRTRRDRGRGERPRRVLGLRRPRDVRGVCRNSAGDRHRRPDRSDRGGVLRRHALGRRSVAPALPTRDRLEERQTRLPPQAPRGAAPRTRSREDLDRVAVARHRRADQRACPSRGSTVPPAVGRLRHNHRCQRGRAPSVDRVGAVVRPDAEAAGRRVPTSSPRRRR